MESKSVRSHVSACTVCLYPQYPAHSRASINICCLIVFEVPGLCVIIALDIVSGEAAA